MEIRRLTQEEWQRVLDVIDGEADVTVLTTPEELHQLAWNYNWDDGVETMRQVALNPLSDQGTALLIYWYNQPGWIYQYAIREEVPEWAVDSFDLAKEIESRYLTGFYTQSDFFFDPQNDDGIDWLEEVAEYTLKQQIPVEMTQATQGVLPVREAF